MKNCLIMGSGRSGTSMLAGILHQAGYFIGEKLYKPLPSNPKGFFEWMEITRINEEILSRYEHSMGKNQRWLSSIPLTVDITYTTHALNERIQNVLQRIPFGYKDPRFSYTLPVWRRFLHSDVVFLCVFREPNVTVKSILKECHTRTYLKNVTIKRSVAYTIWSNIYAHVLKHNDAFGKFFFVHYNQIYDGSVLSALSEFLEVNLSYDFVERKLNRTRTVNPVPANVKETYWKLCELAQYSPSVLSRRERFYDCLVRWHTDIRKRIYV